MKVKFIAGKLTDEQKKKLNVSDNRDPDYSSYFTIGKVYTVLGLTYINELDYWTTMLFELCDDIKNSTSPPSCLFEIIDPRPSVFWRARHNFPNFTLWPTEFYREFFHDDLSEEKTEIRRVFDRVVDRLTYEFEDAMQNLPDPLSWPFEDYK